MVRMLVRMKQTHSGWLWLFLCAMAASAHAQQPGDVTSGSSSRARFESVKPGAVRWTDGFMKAVWDRNAEQTIPHLWERYQSKELAGYFLNFQNLADGTDTGFLNGDVGFVDGDFYKWLEAVCYLLAQDRKSEWHGTVDKIVEVLARCQERARARYGPDFVGFLATHTQLSDRQPLSDRSRSSEVYCLGHLMSLAAVHHRVTGKTNLLTLGQQAGDLLWRATRKEHGKTWLYWDHAAILGAVELYRETKEHKYFDLARLVVDSKGAHYPQDKAVNWNVQDNGRFLDQTRAVGHAQRANYLYAGAADVFLEGGNAAYRDTLTRIWQDIVDSKLYVTGGTGSIHGFDPQHDGWKPAYPNPPGEPKAEAKGTHVTEAYGPPYYLPNEGAYCEGCAQCGMALFCWRMLRATGEAQYADLLEKELLNGILSGISQDGKRFFYTNKLRRLSEDIYQMDARRRTGSSLPERLPGTNKPFPPRMNAQCCPPNYARLLAMSPGMAYGITDHPRVVRIHLYGSNEIDAQFQDGTKVKLTQEAPDFPWAGSIRITVRAGGNFACRLRIPSWAKTAALACGGKTEHPAVAGGAYVEIANRKWSAGDTIQLDLEMPVVAIPGNPRTGSAQTGKVAIQRGPIVYCAERIDNPMAGSATPFERIAVAAPAELRPVRNRDLGVTALESKEAYLVPYFAWGNRSDDYMVVWLESANQSASGFPDSNNPGKGKGGSP